MRNALMVMRNRPVNVSSVNFHLLGWIKYSLALAAGFAFIAMAIAVKQPWLLFAAVLAFYIVEVQMAFAFPLAIDGSAKIFRDSRQWVLRAGGTGRAIVVVVPIAATMLFGGICGGGFLRSWCIGCLAILAWYERLKKEPVVSRSALEIGASQALEVRYARFKFLNNPEALRVLYASDLHFLGRHSRMISKQLISIVREHFPDIVLLGGDLVDGRRGLDVLRETITSLHEVAPVAAIPGNHDCFVGLEEVRQCVELASGFWLEDNSFSLQRAGMNSLWIDGLLSKPVSPARGRILCAHDPKIFPEAARRQYSLVLAGHLHGGQCVLTERNKRLFPGAWFYRWNGLRFESDNSTMLVSRGVSDTIPIRLNCPREVILCEIC